MALLAVAVLVLGALGPAAALLDFGPIKPYLSVPYSNGQTGEGFPLWYQDNSGNMCEPCLYADPGGTADLGCLSTVSFVGEKADEFFYYHAGATMEVADATSGGIGVLFETAVEGAYLNGPPVPGEEMVFQRTRIRINCPTEVPPEGKPYFFRVTTPYGHTHDLVADRRASGNACVFTTIDVGATAGNFAENMAGPITSFLVADTGVERQPGMLGTLPGVGKTKLGALLPDASRVPQRLLVEFPTVASDGYNPADYTNPFAKLSAAAAPQPQADTGPVDVFFVGTDRNGIYTEAFATSCKQFTGPVARITDAKLSVSADDESGKTATVEVWALAPAGRNLDVTITGFPAASGTSNLVRLTQSTEPALNPLVPSEYVVDEPVLYYGRKQVVRTDEAQWSTNLALAENGVVAERRVGIKARIKAKTVTLTAAGTLKFTLDSRDGTHVKCGHFNTKGQFKKLDGLSVNNAGLSARKLLGAVNINVDFVSNVAPPVIHCCPDSISSPTPADCRAFEVDTDGTATTAASETNIQPAARLTSHSVSATAGVGFSVDASDSFPGPLDESTCTTQWTVVEEDNTEFGVPKCNGGYKSHCDSTAERDPYKVSIWPAEMPWTSGTDSQNQACALKVTFELTCGSAATSKATASASVIVSPASVVSYAVSNNEIMFAVPSTTPTTLSTALKQYYGVPVRLLLQVTKKQGTIGEPTFIDFTVPSPILEDKSKPWQCTDGAVSDLTTYPSPGDATVRVTSRVYSCTPPLSALPVGKTSSTLSFKAVPSAEGKSELDTKWAYDFEIKRDVIAATLSVFKIKNGQWSLRFIAMTTEAGSQRADWPVTLGCFYTGNRDCATSFTAECEGAAQVVFSGQACPAGICDEFRVDAGRTYTWPLLAANAQLGVGARHFFWCKSSVGGTTSVSAVARS